MKRSDAKQATHKRLLKIAKQEFIKKGFLNTTTIEIAKIAGVAHGTLFLHFQTKDNLILEIFDQELMKITDELYTLLKDAYEIDELLHKYLEYLQQEEPFFVTIAREISSYPGELRRKIFFRESAIRGYFYQALEQGIKAGQLKPVNITMALNFLFGTIHYFLNLKMIYAPEGNVIKANKQLINNTFIQLIRS